MVLEPVKSTEGLVVLHLFFKLKASFDAEPVLDKIKQAELQDAQVVTVALLGHKADICFMILHEDAWVLRDIQTSLCDRPSSPLLSTGLELVDSYVSHTELSEYAVDMPPAMANMRLNPKFPVKNKHAWCFYPMTKRRNPQQNWYQLGFEERQGMMYEHGASGRKFAGRVIQLVTGSSGLDDWEWAVTLFGNSLNDLKEIVYTMRYDRVSAVYAEFGRFYTGLSGPAEEILKCLTSGGNRKAPTITTIGT